MEEEPTILSTLGNQQLGEAFRSEATKFVFVESQIVQSLREAENLVYIEVPNESIGERIEKGLKDVFLLKRKIVMGMDTINLRKSPISKFIIVQID